MLVHTQLKEGGSVVLVALCCIVVSGIALASYLAFSSQTVKLSNRSLQIAASKHYAEAGIEKALWSINHNNWSGWVTTNAPAAILTTTTSFVPTGMVPQIKIGVSCQNVSVWNSNAAYTTTDLVWYLGKWYQCRSDNTNQPPTNLSPWISAPSAWSSTTSYAADDIVYSGDSTYRCIGATPHVNQPPPSSPTYWIDIPVDAWNPTNSYVVNNIVSAHGTLYRCFAPNTNQEPPNPTYWAGAPIIISEGACILPDPSAPIIKTQIKAEITLAQLFPNAAAATTTLALSTSGTFDSYSSNLGVNTFLSQQNGPSNYSAVIASASSMTISGSPEIHGYLAWPSPPAGISSGTKVWGYLGPTSPNLDISRISRSPYIPRFDETTWNSSSVYRINDIVRASDGKLYVSKINNNTNQYPPSSSSAWNGPRLLSLSSLLTTIPDVPSAVTENYLWDGDLDLSGGQIISIVAPVVLDISGYLKIRDGGITLDDPGTAEIHFGDRLSVGSSLTPANPGIWNRTKDSKKLILIGTVTNSVGSSRYSSTQDYYGVIYMPNLVSGPLSVSGNIYGAISTTSLTLNPTANLHYDTALRTAGFRSMDSPFTVTEWRELTDPSEKIVFP